MYMTLVQPSWLECDNVTDFELIVIITVFRFNGYSAEFLDRPEPNGNIPDRYALGSCPHSLYSLSSSSYSWLSSFIIVIIILDRYVTVIHHCHLISSHITILKMTMITVIIVVMIIMIIILMIRLGTPPWFWWRLSGWGTVKPGSQSSSLTLSPSSSSLSWLSTSPSCPPLEPGHLSLPQVCKWSGYNAIWWLFQDETIILNIEIDSMTWKTCNVLSIYTTR